MTKLKNNRIQWTPRLVDINKIKPTPVNYKIRNALGAERLKEMLKSFGIAGTVVVDTNMVLIDGNSRVEEEKAAGTKKLWVSYPDRKMTSKEFAEMSALFDFAKAGDVDTERIQGDLGKTKDFYKRFNMEIPKRMLDKLGAKQLNDYKAEKKEKKDATLPEQNLAGIMLVQLFFSEKQHAEFRELEELWMKKFKSKRTEETILKVMQQWRK